MGCDIHLCVEQQINNNWYALDEHEWPMNRNYTLFAHLANVRNYSCVQPVSDPRGLPSDVSSPVEAYFKEWGEDIDSLSWISQQEYEESIKGIDRALDKLISYLTEVYPFYPYRLVFGFDN